MFQNQSLLSIIVQILKFLFGFRIKSFKNNLSIMEIHQVVG